METLRMLFLLHVPPSEKHISTVLINNLTELSKKENNIKYVFFLYDQKKQKNKQTDNVFLYFDQFSDAIEVLQKFNPNIVYLNEDRSTIDLSFHIACDYLHIPIICPINHFWLSNYKVSKKTSFLKFKLLLNSIFSNTAFDSKNTPFSSKFKFLLNTMKKSQKNVIQISLILLKLFYSQLTTKPLIFSKSSNTMFRLETENSIPILLKKKFPKSNLFVTGNPIYDEVFKRINNFTHNQIQEKINILFAPSQLFEDGVWSKHDSDQSFIQILRILSNHKEKLSVKIKIHPTSVSLSDYTSLLSKIDSTIPIYQQEDFLDLLEDCDVVIGYPANSTMLRYSLLAKKPIILCNFFNNSSCEFLQQNLALECKSPDNLINLIFEIIKNNPSHSKTALNFIHENFYKSDGLSTNRLMSAIDLFLKQINSSKFQY